MCAVLASVVLLAFLPPDATRAVDAQARPSTAPVFPSGAEVVLLDLVARSRDGRPVTDLRADEVQVFENGKPCAVSSFRLVRAELEGPPGSTATSGSGAIRTELAGPGPTAVAAGMPAAGGSAGSLILLVFDQLGPEGGPRARAAAADMLKRPFPRGSWFAVYKIGQGLRVLQPLTRDLRALPAAIERATVGSESAHDPSRDPKYDSSTEEALVTALQAGGLGNRVAGAGTVAIGSIPASGVDHAMLVLQAKMLRFSDQNTREQRGHASLQPLLSIARGLALVGGRKTLLYFSEGLDVPPAVEDVFRTTVSFANRANVSIYSFDARGLRVKPPSEETRLALALATGQSEAAAAPTPGEGVDTARDALRLNRQGVLRDLAESTGGFLVAETNDLRPGLDRVAADLRSFYEIAYVPPDPRPDGRWRGIEVKVARSGVTVRTRKGYFAFPPGAPIVRPSELPLVAALASSPLPRDVEQRSAVLRVVDAEPSAEAVLLVKVPLSAATIEHDEAAGLWRAHVELLGLVKDAKDELVARLSHDAPLEGPLAEEGTVQQGALVVRRPLRLAPGRYTLETAVLDRPSGRVGARRSAFDIPSTGSGLAIGSVVVVRPEELPEGAGAERGEADDPLRAGRLRAAPLLGAPLPQGTPVASVFLSLHPAATAEPVELELELRQEGRTLARVRPGLPAPDATGRIGLIGAIPISRCGPGGYEVLARARQGAAEAVEGTSFTIAPAPGAAAGESSTAASEGARAPLAAPLRPIEAAPDALQLLEKAGQYVAEFQQSFRNVVAEEFYRQWAGSMVRTLRSDLVFVTVPGDLPWATFRDVFEVDGQKVRDRDARLEAVFTKTSEASLERANAILHESARYNLGPLYRTVNVPTLALSFLLPQEQWRLRWERKGLRRFHGHDAVELRAVETARPTLVHADGDDLPAEVRFWVEVGTGRVLRSEAGFRRHINPVLREMLSSIDVQYRPEPALGLWVPEEMYERYDNVPYAMREDMEHFDGTIQGRARYTNARRFSVTTESAVRDPGQPRR
jgi:VWFA-related protein